MMMNRSLRLSYSVRGSNTLVAPRPRNPARVLVHCTTPLVPLVNTVTRRLTVSRIWVGPTEALMSDGCAPPPPAWLIPSKFSFTVVVTGGSGWARRPGPAAGTPVLGPPGIRALSDADGFVPVTEVVGRLAPAARPSMPRGARPGGRAPGRAG